MVLQARLPGATFADAATLHEALALDAEPDVIVLDVNLPGLNGLEGLAPLQRRWPAAGIVMLSAQDDAETRRIALTLGAAAFVSKAEAGARIGETIDQLLHAGMPSGPDNSPPAQPYLTPRQYEVLNLLSQGLTNKLIARQIDLSDNTVRRHVQDIFAFFGVATRTEAVFEARRQGLIR